MDSNVLIPIFLTCALFVLWLISLWLKDASIVDIFWGPGFAAIAAIGLWRSPDATVREQVFGLLAIIWGVRLGLYLAWRNIGRGEDRRYQAIRARYGARFPLLSLPLVFLFQGGLIWIISSPLQTIGGQAGEWRLADTIGGLIWLIGFGFEVVGDWQLARFKSDPANRVAILDRGLWGWTRHPNYFGDALVWWGLTIPVIAAGAPWTIISPLIMTWLLRRFSGVPLLERGLRESRPGYEEYVARTSPFFPRPPRRREQR